MSWKCQIYALAALALISSGFAWADDQNPVAEPNSGDETYQPVFTDGTPRADHEPMFLTRGQTPYARNVALRFGWWGADVQGSPEKIGEWEGLESSAFFDADGLLSDGHTTTDFHASGPDDETTDVGLRVYRPGLDFEMGFDRFIHRLEHDPLDNFAGTNLADSRYGASTDLDPGDEYAVRVQQFDAKFKGHLTDNISWGLNLWGMRKTGQRGVRAGSHAGVGGCGGACHVQGQTQNIDWLTMEIEPVITAKLDAVTVEYSRTMRAFNQNDGIATRQYGADRHGRALRPIAPPAPDGDGLPYDYPYAVTAENFTQIDRLKFGADLTRNTQFYANVFFGDTENRNTEVHRSFDGFDLRVTNRSIDNLKVTAYTKRTTEKTQLPSVQHRRDILGLDNPDYSGTTLDGGNVNPGNPTYWPGTNLYADDPTEAELIGAFRQPASRTRVTAGARARWTPFTALRGFALTGGYEYRSIERDHVTYMFNELAAGEDIEGRLGFTQPTTKTNMFHVGTEFAFSKHLDSFIRYKMTQTKDPMFGFVETLEVGDPPSAAFSTYGQALNTNLPEHEDLIEFGGTWAPRYNLMFSGTVGIQKRHHSSDYADFDEEDYPIIFTAWYAPTNRWSISGGIAFFSNWIDQQITIGKNHEGHGTIEEIYDVPFEYGGRAEVVNLGTTYAATDRLTLSGNFEHTRSFNGLADPTIPQVSLVVLPGATDVLAQTTRFTAGFDYELREQVSTYFRYTYYDYNDKAGNGRSGTANFFLGGLTATY